MWKSVEDLKETLWKSGNDTTTMWTDPLFMNGYAQWSGDSDGLLQALSPVSSHVANEIADLYVMFLFTVFFVFLFIHIYTY